MAHDRFRAAKERQRIIEEDSDHYEMLAELGPRKRRTPRGQGVVSEQERARLVAEFLQRGGTIKRCDASNSNAPRTMSWMRAPKKETA